MKRGKSNLASVVATYPSQQQEHITGFQTEAAAEEWLASAIIETGFIIFLFYSNLLMGQFTL